MHEFLYKSVEAIATRLLRRSRKKKTTEELKCYINKTVH